MFASLYFIQTAISNGPHASSFLILTAVISPRKTRNLKNKESEEIAQYSTSRQWKIISVYTNKLNPKFTFSINLYLVYTGMVWCLVESGPRPPCGHENLKIHILSCKI
jgi:hypothetical protein